MKNDKLTLLDDYQITRATFDENHDAQRVILVGGDGKQIADSIKDALKDIKVEIKQEDKLEHYNHNITIPDPQIIKIPYQTIVKEIEIKEIEKPIIITEVKVIEIEKPILIKEVQIKEIDKPIIIKEYERFPKYIVWLFTVQMLISLGTLIVNIFHK